MLPTTFFERFLNTFSVIPCQGYHYAGTDERAAARVPSLEPKQVLLSRQLPAGTSVYSCKATFSLKLSVFSINMMLLGTVQPSFGTRHVPPKSSRPVQASRGNASTVLHATLNGLGPSMVSINVHSVEGCSIETIPSHNVSFLTAFRVRLH
jgi:hypothetical protein